VASKHRAGRTRNGIDAASVGIEVALAVTAGFFLGRWFDATFEMAPWGSVLWLAAGFGAAIKALVRTARMIRRTRGPVSAEDKVQEALAAARWGHERGVARRGGSA